MILFVRIHCWIFNHKPHTYLTAGGNLIICKKCKTVLKEPFNGNDENYLDEYYWFV